MKAEKLKRLRAAGWRAGSARDFLQLSDEEAALVEIKLSLTDAVRQARTKHKLSQSDLALRIKSSQSRVAKIEAGDPGVSLDLIVRALFAAGATRKEVQKAFVSRLPASPKKSQKANPKPTKKTNPPYTDPLNNRSTLSTSPSYNRSRLIPELEKTVCYGPPPLPRPLLPFGRVRRSSLQSEISF